MSVPPSHLMFVPPVDIGSLTLVVVLPLLVEVAVLVRGAYTREPTDIVLAAVAVPCLLVSTWAVLEASKPAGGVYWGGVFSIAAGGLLTLLVVMDAIIEFAVERQALE